MTAALPKMRIHQPRGATFPVRHPDMAFDGLARYWMDDDPFITHFLNVLSGLFPDGEQFFVDSVRAFRERIRDPRLACDVGAFIGQEAVHSREHEAYNRHADAVGHDVAFVERATAAMMKIWRRASPIQQLALTVGTEHLTAALGQTLLETPELRALISDPRMERLLTWHALEETEHKAVAFDVLREIDDDYLRRVAAITVVFAMGVPLVLGCQVHLMLRDGQLFNLRSWGRGMRILFGRRGFISRSALRIGDFYRPGFHPDDHDTRALLAEWRRRLEDGAAA